MLFWLLILVLLTLLFTRSYGDWRESFYFVSMIMPVVVGTAYFFNYHLVPKFLLVKRYFLFGLYTVYLIIVSLFLEMVAITVAYIFLANYRYDNMSPITSDPFVLAGIVYGIVFMFSFIRLTRQLKEKEHQVNDLQQEQRKQKVGSIVIRSNRKNVQLAYNNILYVESLSDYVKIYLSDGRHLITKEKISTLNELLPDQFIRIHRSYLVNRNKIESYNKESIQLNGGELPISRSYKQKVMQILDVGS